MSSDSRVFAGSGTPLIAMWWRASTLMSWKNANKNTKTRRARQANKLNSQKTIHPTPPFIHHADRLGSTALPTSAPDQVSTTLPPNPVPSVPSPQRPPRRKTKDSAGLAFGPSALWKLTDMYWSTACAAGAEKAAQLVEAEVRAPEAYRKRGGRGRHRRDVGLERLWRAELRAEGGYKGGRVELNFCVTLAPSLTPDPFRGGRTFVPDPRPSLRTAPPEFLPAPRRTDLKVDASKAGELPEEPQHSRPLVPTPVSPPRFGVSRKSAGVLAGGARRVVRKLENPREEDLAGGRAPAQAAPAAGVTRGGC
ncbi:hypothetical protein DFJ73DRAFT_759252 [Zopfochytrium polystomum]|nr:hypothetical protein DFJ73DRAFT_759252 [Zopfochytrium polystomum]